MLSDLTDRGVVLLGDAADPSALHCAFRSAFPTTPAHWSNTPASHRFTGPPLFFAFRELRL
ncbi:hypothetical protein AB0E69_25405 [Kribbella sp. NPDC026611]|uniref:hypothetical protein n=1 Tax=Kribbella sp. NPDC026611 TaxID=3154911 RepID=UPI0033F80688